MVNDMIKVNDNYWVNRFWVTYCYCNESGKTVVLVGRPGGSYGLSELEADCSLDEMIKRLRF
jgi:hypothetical protein